MTGFAFRRIATLICMLGILAACNTPILSSFKPPTPPVQQTLIALTQNYLQGIVDNKTEKTLNFRAFSPSGQDHSGLSRDSLAQQLEATTSTAHPLIGFHIVEVLTKENEAKVRLIKDVEGKSQMITIYFNWAGRGWVITHDDIFGPQGLLIQ